MTLTKGILRIMARNHALGAHELYEYLYKESASSGKKINPRSLNTILSRLKRDGILNNVDQRWSITPAGKSLLQKKQEEIKKFFRIDQIQNNRSADKKMIIIFDIPEKRKRYREWLRTELVGFGFTLIQKSVWLGPGLPKEFVEYLNKNGLLKHVRFFKASEQDLI